MNKQLLLTVVIFVIALGSGIAIGTALHRSPPPGRDRSWLADELGLSPTQRDQMRQIWSDALHTGGPSPFERRRQYQKERDEAFAALLTPDQKAAYDKALDRYNQQMAQMNKQREAAFQVAAEKTKAILTDPQRAKYEELLKKGPMGPPWGHHPGSGPSTAPEGPGHRNPER